MKKSHEIWTIEKLVKNIDEIEFPEFQREPTVWGLEKKQRLIDSILRGFDISLIYFFKKKNGSYDCIDGRQRINAMFSFLGLNDADEEDNEFHLKISNEVFDDVSEFKDVDNKRYNSLAPQWQNIIKDFPLNIVIISQVKDPNELNLLFLRLQLGSILNAGEKLHAMTGDVREFIFNDLNNHDFFKELGIPYKRYAREQVAAQIVLNVFSKRDSGEFHRSRYLDLQDFFKQFSNFNPEDVKTTKGIKRTLDIIKKHIGTEIKLLKSRAIAVSAYFFMSELIEQKKDKDINIFVEFLAKFLRTLKWQIPKGFQRDQAYDDLFKFQTYVTQAAGERYSIENRHSFLHEYFKIYKKERIIKGDKEYAKETKKDPDSERDS